MKNKRTNTQVSEKLEEFIIYMSSSWRLIWTNFVAGVFRGLGAMIGASVVIAFLLWFLSIFANLPLIGEYVAEYILEVQQTIKSYVENTNYKEDFIKLQQTLERVENKLP